MKIDRVFFAQQHVLEPDNPLERPSFYVNAVNLPADNGKITAVNLLYSPDLMTKGTKNAKCLGSWKIN